MQTAKVTMANEPENYKIYMRFLTISSLQHLDLEANS